MCSGAIFGDVFHGESKSGEMFRSNSGEKRSPEYILELLAEIKSICGVCSELFPERK